MTGNERVKRCLRGYEGMIDRIEICPGDVGWTQAAPLLKSVWPPEVVATLPWRDVAWASPDQRVLVFDRGGEIVGHVAIVVRSAGWNGRVVKVGGLGSVATREDSRLRGVARMAIANALREIAEAHKADFGLLFCEPRHAPLYKKLGWRSFAGDVFVTQPRGRVRFDVTDPYVFDLKLAPRSGVLDLCGLPW
jgi:aminoglycoside 2'-N-acetyltransferase I